MATTHFLVEYRFECCINPNMWWTFSHTVSWSWAVRPALVWVFYVLVLMRYFCVYWSSSACMSSSRAPVLLLFFCHFLFYFGMSLVFVLLFYFASCVSLPGVSYCLVTCVCILPLSLFVLCQVLVVRSMCCGVSAGSTFWQGNSMFWILSLVSLLVVCSQQ